MSCALLQVETLGMLVDRLRKEHKDFSSQTDSLARRIKEMQTFDQIIEIFAPLKDALVDYILTEETEIFPEVSRRGLFSERISEIMQQHVDITAALDKMKFGLRGKNIGDLQEAFDELSAIMKLHFPAEEKEIFPLVV
jgi:hemerythrin